MEPYETEAYIFNLWETSGFDENPLTVTLFHRGQELVEELRLLDGEWLINEDALVCYSIVMLSATFSEETVTALSTTYFDAIFPTLFFLSQELLVSEHCTGSDAATFSLATLAGSLLVHLNPQYPAQAFPMLQHELFVDAGTCDWLEQNVQFLCPVIH